MKTVRLAGGFGTRLFEYTDDIPKPVVPRAQYDDGRPPTQPRAPLQQRCLKTTPPDNHAAAPVHFNADLALVLLKSVHSGNLGLGRVFTRSSATVNLL